MNNPGLHQALARARKNQTKKIPKDELLKLLSSLSYDYKKVAEVLKKSPSTIAQYACHYGITRTRARTREPARVSRVHIHRADGPQLIDFSEAPIGGVYGIRGTDHVDHGRKLTLEDI